MIAIGGDDLKHLPKSVKPGTPCRMACAGGSFFPLGAAGAPADAACDNAATGVHDLRSVPGRVPGEDTLVRHGAGAVLRREQGSLQLVEPGVLLRVEKTGTPRSEAPFGSPPFGSVT